mmetsp:Transcript_6130/g.15316  ORF Transcript_6130/g.15316 Transcript_6130/m.15316 type:complete len:725 (+) Transcript_6130:833-3007(+)
MVNLVVRHSNTPGTGASHGQHPQQIERNTPVKMKIPSIITSSRLSPRGEASKFTPTTSTSTANINISTTNYEQPAYNNSPSAYRSPVGGEDASIPKNKFEGSSSIARTNASPPRSPRSSRSRREMSLFLSSTAYGRNMSTATPTTATTTIEPRQEVEETTEPRNDSSDYIHSVAEERQAPPTASSISLSSKLASGSADISTTTTPTELVCDYDQSVTALYEMLESSRWDDALRRCQTHPVECHTWIVRRVHTTKSSRKNDEQQNGSSSTTSSSSNNNIRWKLLPLHAAVIFQSPASLIAALIQEHPSAVSKRDDQGMLPLHLAFRHKLDEAIVGHLIGEYPQGVLCKDNRDRLPIDHGKESRYSAYLLKLLLCEMKMINNHDSDEHKCSHSRDSSGNRSKENNKSSSIRISRSVNDRDRVRTISGQAVQSNNDIVDQVHKVTAMYETKMKELEEVHQAQVLTLTEEHEKLKREMQMEMESSIQQTSKQHTQEMDELRSMLAREVASRQKSDQFQSGMEQLKLSLGDYQQECKVLRRVVHDQKIQYDNLLEDMVQLTNDQKLIHETFQQQEEELNHSKYERELLLKKLLQLDEGPKGSSTRSTIELSQILHRISSRNDQARNKYQRGLTTLKTPEVVQKGVLGHADVTKKPSIVVATATDLVMTHRSNYNPPTPLMDDERRLICCADDYQQPKRETTPSPAAAAWNNNDNHSYDDVSAITENTNF